MEPYTKAMFTITKVGLQVLEVHADVLKYSTEYFTNEIVPIYTEPRRGRYYESCMHTSIQYYRADRAAVVMHDGAAVRSTPLLASAGGQSTATGVFKAESTAVIKQVSLQKAFATHPLALMPGASAAAATEDIIMDVPIVMTMENLAQVSVSWR